MKPQFDQETPLRPNQTTPFNPTPMSTMTYEEQSINQRKKLLSQLSTPGSSNTKSMIDPIKILGLEYLPIFTSYSLPDKTYLISEARSKTALEDERELQNYNTTISCSQCVIIKNNKMK